MVLDVSRRAGGLRVSGTGSKSFGFSRVDLEVFRFPTKSGAVGLVPGDVRG